jgi:hypothetical protein
MTVADWYPEARKAILSCLSSVLSIDDRLSNPDRTNDGILLPDMPLDERARLAYYQESDLLQLAHKIRNLAASADWAALVADAEVATNTARRASRAAYNERTAALTNPGGA